MDWPPDTIGIVHIPKSVVLSIMKMTTVCIELPNRSAIVGIFSLFVAAYSPYTGLMLAPKINGAMDNVLNQ